jgi:hypothetical protein
MTPGLNPNWTVWRHKTNTRYRAIIVLTSSCCVGADLPILATHTVVPRAPPAAAAAMAPTFLLTADPITVTPAAGTGLLLLLLPTEAVAGGSLPSADGSANRAPLAVLVTQDGDPLAPAVAALSHVAAAAAAASAPPPVLLPRWSPQPVLLLPPLLLLRCGLRRPPCCCCCCVSPAASTAAALVSTASAAAATAATAPLRPAQTTLLLLLLSIVADAVR